MKDMMLQRPYEITPQFAMERERDEDIDLPGLFGTISDNKWLLLIGTSLIAALSLVYSMAATPRYQASALLQVQRSSPATSPQTNAPLVEQPRGSQAATEIPLLTSRTLFADAVNALQLDVAVEPRRFPLVGNFLARRYQSAHAGQVAPPVLGMDSFGWGGERLALDAFVVPDGMRNKPFRLIAGTPGRYTLRDVDGNDLLRGRVGDSASARGVTIDVRELRANEGTMFDLTQRSQLAAVSELADSIEASERGRDSGIIAVSYESTDPETAAQVLGHITSSYIRENLQRNSAEAENSLKFVKEQLPKVRAELTRAQTALNDFQTRSQTTDIDMQTQALLNQLVAINASLQQLRTQQPEISRRFTGEHPAARALGQQIGQLEREKGAIQARMSRLPDIQEGLFRLTRDVDVTNRTYTNLLDQAQKLDIARASAIGNTHVIDRPTVDMTKPVWPKPVPIVAGATTLGGLLLLGFVFLRQTLNRGVEDPAAIERLGLPVYTSIMKSSQEKRSLSARTPRLQHEMHPRLLALDSPSDVAMEALRCLRTSLHFARVDSNSKLLMIVGPNSGVGKTFVASNLGVTVAQAGQRVLVIDADMRRGALHLVLGARPEDGLSELLAGQLPLEEAVRQVRDTPNLSFISRGRLPPNPSELLMRPAFSALLRRLESSYDLIIIDTPPVLAVTDATVIGQHVGTTLMVVRFGMTQEQEITLAKRRLEQSGVTVQGAIVNAVEKRGVGNYVYGYYENRPEAA